MGRLQIALPTEILEHLKDITASEQRSPREQIEYFVIRAVRETERASPKTNCPGDYNTGAVNAPKNPPAEGDSNGAL